jgi:hypothetical protein
VLLARVLVAQDKLDEARAALLFEDLTADPEIHARTELVRAVLDVRTAERAQNTRDHAALMARAHARLLPIVDTRPDPAETIELSCALAQCAGQLAPDDAIRVLAETLARVEQAEIRATPWVRTGLRCESVAGREGLVREVAQRVTDATALTYAIDHSREGSPLRRYLAERLLGLLADRPQDTPRFMRWLADLPDDRATQGRTQSSAQTTTVVGLLAPMSGTRSSVATSLLRGAQLAVETAAAPGRPSVRIVIEDEGESPTQIAAAIERLARQGARTIIGPTRADFAPSAAIAAQSLGVSLYLLNASPGVEQTGTLVRRAGASFEERAQMLAGAVSQFEHTARVTVIAASVSELLADACEDHLQERAVGYTRLTWDGPTFRGSFAAGVLVAGVFGAEARAAIAERAGRSRVLWVIDALAARGDRVELVDRSSTQSVTAQSRVADLRTAGVWVGLRAGEGFVPTLTRFCERYAESPDEFALMAHDATVRGTLALAGVAVGDAQLALDSRLQIVSARIAANLQWNNTMPAASATCPRTR